MEGTRESYEKALGGINYFMRDLGERTEEMDKINIREM